MLMLSVRNWIRNKIIYLRVVEIDERWSQRMLRGFHKYMDEIREIFKNRYP
jgi:transposase-like protein